MTDCDRPACRSHHVHIGGKPAKPDIAQADAFLIRAYREAWETTWRA